MKKRHGFVLLYMYVKIYVCVSVAGNGASRRGDMGGVFNGLVDP